MIRGKIVDSPPSRKPLWLWSSLCGCKKGQSRPPFCLFSVFSIKQYNSHNNLLWKMSIEYLVSGFKLTTFWLQVFSLNHICDCNSENFWCVDWNSLRIANCKLNVYLIYLRTIKTVALPKKLDQLSISMVINGNGSDAQSH